MDCHLNLGNRVDISTPQTSRGTVIIEACADDGPFGGSVSLQDLSHRSLRHRRELDSPLEESH